MSDWSDPRLFRIKRKLSRYEKSSLLEPQGHALILPGLPGTEGCPEVDELMAVGYGLRNIVGVERDEYIAEAIWDKYMDTMQVHCLSLEEYLSLARLQYSYIHADLCGCVTPELFVAFDHLPRISAPILRLRVSSLRPRKRADQARFEELFHRAVVANLFRQCGLGELFTEQGDPTDASQLLLGAFLCHYFFGISPRVYADEGSGLLELPPVLGSHLIHTLIRGNYYDSSPSSMVTMWLDLVPLPEVYKTDPQFSLSYIRHILSQCLGPVPSFNLPELYDQGESP